MTAADFTYQDLVKTSLIPEQIKQILLISLPAFAYLKI